MYSRLATPNESHARAGSALTGRRKGYSDGGRTDALVLGLDLGAD